MTQELGPNQKAWIAALRSGKYKQGQNWLNNDGKLCCLGVACEVMGMPSEPANTGGGVTQYGDYAATETAPPETVHYFGLWDGNGGPRMGIKAFALSELNDSKDYTFEQIAGVLEKSPEVYFREPC